MYFIAVPAEISEAVSKKWAKRTNKVMKYWERGLRIQPFQGHTAVSYTHLDVYKRQIENKIKYKIKTEQLIKVNQNEQNKNNNSGDDI